MLKLPARKLILEDVGFLIIRVAEVEGTTIRGSFGWTAVELCASCVMMMRTALLLVAACVRSSARVV